MAIETPYDELDKTKATLKAKNLEDLTDETKLANLHHAQAMDFYENARQVVSNIDSLIKTLERERDQMVRDPRMATPNGLGIMQGQASFVEASVGEFVASKDALRRIEVALGLAEPLFPVS